MSLLEQIMTIAVVVIATMTTRFLPFIIFPPDKKIPEIVSYLGKLLPGAALGLLVVYCFKDINVFDNTQVVSSLLGGIMVVGLHLLKRNMLLSIAGGTIFYMVLVQVVF
ncbi:MAG: AzlD domain-containing protein [Erysipelotrichaceae bacterium]|nr:AzlD domain-containing protein [Erysipelotrichaceae bacterium]